MSLRTRLYIALGIIFGVFLGAAVWEINAYHQAREEVLNAFQANQDLLEVSNTLVITLVVSVAVDLLMLGLAWYFVRNWIMEPLLKIRKVMVKVADGDITKVIRPIGPPEIQEVAVAAEDMRRNLVAQIDFTRSAEWTLEDEGNQTLSSELRKSLKPTFKQSDFPHFEIDAYSQAAAGVISGDWWDIYTSDILKSQSSSSLQSYVVLVDVEGHDPATGIVALKVKAIMGDQLKSGIQPEIVIQNVSRLLADIDNKLLSAFILELPMANSEKAKWLNAGHPSALLFHQDGEHQLLDQTGMVIAGIDGEWTMREFLWKSGDTVVIATDGLMELRDIHNNEFGNEGIINAVSMNSNKAARYMVDHIVAYGQQFASNETNTSWSHEDITVIAVTRQKV